MGTPTWGAHWDGGQQEDATGWQGSFLFDGDQLTGWDGCCNGAADQWVAYTFDEAVVVDRYEMSTMAGECPEAWTMYGGAGDEATATVSIDAQAGQPCSDGQFATYDVSTPASYRTYKLVFQLVGNGVRLREIRFQRLLESEPDQPSPPCLSCAESPATCDEASGMVAEGGCAFACSLAGGGTEADHAWLAAAYSGFGCGALPAESEI